MGTGVGHGRWGMGVGHEGWGMGVSTGVGHGGGYRGGHMGVACTLTISVTAILHEPKGGSSESSSSKHL